VKQIGIILIIIIFFFSCNEKEEQRLLIASASSLRSVSVELIKAFSEETNIKADLISASSGKLSVQIELGAPYDIFLSANEKYPNYLCAKLNLKDESSIFAYGQLVLLLTKQKQLKLNSIDVLLENEIQKIAIPNPDLAPYGIAAMEILKLLQLDKQVKSKLVYGENVNQTNQFLKSKVVDAGFTSVSSIQNSHFRGDYKIISILDSLYNPIKNTVLVVAKKTFKKEKAQKFKAFLQEEKAKSILKKYGYNIP